MRLTDQDREILVDMIKARFEKPGYSDEEVAKTANDQNLLNGQKIKAAHVMKIRNELGLRKKPGRGSGRSKKTRETAAKPAKTGRRMHYKVAEHGKKKDRAMGDNHPITIADLLQAVAEAKAAGENVADMVREYSDQERVRVGV